MALSSVLHKGDVCLVDFEPTRKGEIGRLRPAIILSDNQDSTIFATVVVIPLSSLVVEDNQPYRYPISKRQKLEKKSDACIYEIRSLSKNRVGEKVATITKGELIPFLKNNRTKALIIVRFSVLKKPRIAISILDFLSTLKQTIISTFLSHHFLKMV
ncbi:hypothetical protein MNB_SUP05-SYMBIONT-5-1053 [hydrothermal vent metagenome]|uniref:Programmed cell death toxin YdcE n=1 Tax=hydrothermal vent metagenome TaxID=652676 RepID=A0A1W1E0T8_9ZZZZ